MYVTRQGLSPGTAQFGCSPTLHNYIVIVSETLCPRPNSDGIRRTDIRINQNNNCSHQPGVGVGISHFILFVWHIGGFLYTLVI